MLLQSNPTLCNFLQYISISTWHRIAFARNRAGFKIYETTLTQNLLFELRLFCDLFPGTSIRMFEAINESINGNDIEFAIKTNQGYLLAPLQAKLLYNSNKYNAMEHGNQINDLIAYANRIKGIPLYLLYNYYIENQFNFNGKFCSVDFTEEQFGCSLVSANYLRTNFAFNRTDRNGNLKWTIPSFLDLHPQNAIPLFTIGCCRDSNSDVPETLSVLFNQDVSNQISNEEINVYSEDELTLKDEWRPFDTVKKGKQKPTDDGYSPKFRILIERQNKK